MPSITAQAIFLAAQPARFKWRNLLVPKVGSSGATTASAALAGRVPTRSGHTLVNTIKTTIASFSEVCGV